MFSKLVYNLLQLFIFKTNVKTFKNILKALENINQNNDQIKVKWHKIKCLQKNFYLVFYKYLFIKKNQSKFQR